jgi:hypothetical protein
MQKPVTNIEKGSEHFMQYNVTTIFKINTLVQFAHETQARKRSTTHGTIVLQHSL